MKQIQVVILDNETNVERLYEHPDYDGEGSFEPYIWEEGNYACDCNRALFFARAVGADEGGAWAAKCSDSRYTVKIFRDGERVYSDA